MVREHAICPECGDPLAVFVEKDENTGEMKIEFWCESAGGDKFGLQISTGLKEKELDGFEVEKTIRKEMRIKLLQRQTDPCEDL